MKTKPKRRKTPDAKASSLKPKLASECPVLPVVKRMSKLLQIEEAMQSDKTLNTREEIIFSISDEIEALRDYTATLRATSIEGALLQLGVIADKLHDLNEGEEYKIRAAERAIYRLVFSIAGVLAKHARSAANEPAITSHLPSFMDPQTWVDKSSQKAKEAMD